VKVLCLADFHYGVRKDNIHFYNYQKNFIHNVIVPFIEKYKPDCIVHLGDLVDNRISINFRTHEHLKTDFLDVMKNIDIPQYYIAGNHDSYYKNTLKINALEKFVTHAEVILSPKIINIKGEDFTFIPWICSDNQEETLNLLSSSATKYCFGHLEINGFEVRRGTLCNHGINKNLFENFQSTLSGHFHNRSIENNIRYIGSCFQFDWSDYGEYKGFALLETDTNQIEYYKNPYNIFNILDYDEDKIPDIKNIKNTYVRINIKNKISESKFNDFISSVEDSETIKYNIINNTEEIKLFLTDEKIIVDNLRETCEDYINSLGLSDVDDIKELFNKIYDKSLMEI
jgi:DNA repair exonuclease SbcCD nuclease subunit